MYMYMHILWGMRCKVYIPVRCIYILVYIYIHIWCHVSCVTSKWMFRVASYISSERVGLGGTPNILVFFVSSRPVIRDYPPSCTGGGWYQCKSQTRHAVLIKIKMPICRCKEMYAKEIETISDRLITLVRRREKRTISVSSECIQFHVMFVCFCFPGFKLRCCMSFSPCVVLSACDADRRMNICQISMSEYMPSVLWFVCLCRDKVGL